MSVLDAFGRPLRSLRVSVTDRCNLRCQYCMPEAEYTWLPREDLLSFEEIGRLAEVFSDQGVDRVRITGGEPLLRRDLPLLVTALASQPALKDLALTTNGVLLEQQAQSLREAGLHRVTVSLDTLRRDRFQTIAKFDSLAAVQAGIAAATRLFGSLKIDTVVMRDVNDDELVDLIEYGRSVNAEVRFIEYMDVGGATRWSMNAVVSKAEILRRLSETFGEIEAINEMSSAPAERFRLKDGATFGIISSTTEPFCASCDRSRVTADGLWYLCLYATRGIDLRGPLRAGASRAELGSLVESIWSGRKDRGAEERLGISRREAFIPVGALKRDAHLEMHTRGG